MRYLMRMIVLGVSIGFFLSAGGDFEEKMMPQEPIASQEVLEMPVPSDEGNQQSLWEKTKEKVGGFWDTVKGWFTPSEKPAEEKNVEMSEEVTAPFEPVASPEVLEMPMPS